MLYEFLYKKDKDGKLIQRHMQTQGDLYDERRKEGFSRYKDLRDLPYTAPEAIAPEPESTDEPTPATEGAEVTEETPAFQCKHCGDAFFDALSLARHTKKAHK